jgi:hypothetical protein
MSSKLTAGFAVLILVLIACYVTGLAGEEISCVRKTVASTETMQLTSWRGQNFTSGWVSLPVASCHLKDYSLGSLGVKAHVEVSILSAPNDVVVKKLYVNRTVGAKQIISFFATIFRLVVGK